jgi:hypothetical protein
MCCIDSTICIPQLTQIVQAGRACRRFGAAEYIIDHGAHGTLIAPLSAEAVQMGGMNGVNSLGGREDAAIEVEWNPLLGT